MERTRYRNRIDSLLVLHGVRKLRIDDDGRQGRTMPDALVFGTETGKTIKMWEDGMAPGVRSGGNCRAEHPRSPESGGVEPPGEGDAACVRLGVPGHAPLTTTSRYIQTSRQEMQECPPRRKWLHHNARALSSVG